MSNIPISSDANLRPTAILDYQHVTIQEIARPLVQAHAAFLEYLRAAHCVLSEQVAPVYTLDEFQPASRTLAKRKGSCSQRFACLEALARARSIATRVRGLWVAGRFWAARFKLTRPFIPRRILLAWPQFHVGGEWLGIESVFNQVDNLARQNPQRFKNDGESLFDAVSHTAIDFEGRTAGCADGHCDLSSYVVGNAGVFPTRDELFASFKPLQRTLRGIAFEVAFGGRKSI